MVSTIQLGSQGLVLWQDSNTIILVRKTSRSLNSLWERTLLPVLKSIRPRLLPIMVLKKHLATLGVDGIIW
jgi:hypothetical protein